jgi:hypothetical protein
MGGVAIQLRQAFRILRHPVDGFWELRYEGRAGIVSASVLIVLVYIVSLVAEITTSYIFHPVDSKFINPTLKFAQVIIPLFTWVIANYMVGSINRGQGRFVDVFVGSAYALTPYILFSIPLSVLSNALTLGESSIYFFGKFIILCWTLFLFFIFVQEIHNYEIGETAWVILLSLFFMFALWILVLIFMGLSTQLIDFVKQIYEEVSYRG